MSPITPNNNPVTKTKQDKQFDATLKIKEIAARLSDTKCALEHIYRVLTDTKSSNKDKKSSLDAITQSIIPFIETTSSTLASHSDWSTHLKESGSEMTPTTQPERYHTRRRYLGRGNFQPQIN